MPPRIETVRDAADATVKAVAWVVDRVMKGATSVGLSGGSTPKAVYEALGRRDDLPWARLHFYFGDERCVPPEHPDSNYRMAREAFARPEVQLHRIRAELADREAAAREYDAVLPDALDVLLLGVGEDGHTASIFPHSLAFYEWQQRVIPVNGPKPPPWRITITPLVIAAAREILVLAPGAGKVAVVKRALDPATLPSEIPCKLAARDGATWIVTG